jgi:hypothetical protein
MTRWVFVMGVSILTLVITTFMLIGLATGSFFNHNIRPYTIHQILLLVLFYWLHWRFQGKAFDLDWSRSERLWATIQSRPHRADPDW